MPFRNEEVRQSVRSRLQLRHENPASELEFLENCMRKVADWRLGSASPQGPFMLVQDEQGPDAAGSAAPQLVNLTMAAPPSPGDVFFCDDRLKNCQRYPGLMTDPSRAWDAATTVQKNTKAYVLFDQAQDRVVIMSPLFPGELVFHLAGSQSGAWSLEALESRIGAFADLHLFGQPLSGFIYSGNKLQEGGRELCRNALLLYLCATLRAPGVYYRAIEGRIVAIRGPIGGGRPVAATWAIGTRICRSWQWSKDHAARYVNSAARRMAAANIPWAQVAFITACENADDVADPTNRVTLRHVA